MIASINLVERINKKSIFYKDSNIKLLDKFLNQYSNFINIKRLFIPIITWHKLWKINFHEFMPLNNILEICENITIKFICIIRHKKIVLFQKFIIQRLKIEMKIMDLILWKMVIIY